jgi:hypothetical protein
MDPARQREAQQDHRPGQDSNRIFHFHKRKRGDIYH